MKPFLKVDEIISLHLARPELAAPVFEAIDNNRTHLSTWLPWVDDTLSLEDTKTFISESMAHNSEGTRLDTFILCGNDLVGSLSVVKFQKEHRKCELGYWLIEDMQGRGIMTKSISVFVRYLFQRKAINRIELQVLVGNQPSKGVPARLGFESEGVQRQAVCMNNQYHDIEMFSLLKQDWLLRKEG